MAVPERADQLAASSLRVVYRSHGGENAKSRPRFYSKLLALASFARATAALDVAPEVVFLNDGPVPADRLDLMRRHGEVVRIEAGSNRGSYRAALALAAGRPWPAGALVWFAEDDYLYAPHSLRTLLAGAAALPRADYLSLYGSFALDLSGGRRRPAARPQPGAAGDPEAVLVDGTPWYRGMSTTSTFGVRARVLREDLHLLRTMPYAGGAFDHITCLTYQGLQPVPGAELRADLLPFGEHPPAQWPRAVARGLVRTALSTRALRRPSRRRVLMAPDPDPIAHLQEGLLPPATDWAALAEDTARWARAHGVAATPVPTRATTSAEDAR